MNPLMKQYLFMAGIALIVSMVVGYAFFNKGTVTTIHEDGTKTVTTVGAAGPDFNSPCESHNGVTTCFTRRNLATGTTTPFAALSPSGTSTLKTFACATSVATSAAQTFVLTKGAGMQASTTAISNQIAVSAGANGVVNASSTQETLRVINPNSWVQFNSFGGVGTPNLTGTCEVEFTII